VPARHGRPARASHEVSSGGVDRYKGLLDPFLAALDAAASSAQRRGADARAAAEFVEYKLYAAVHLGDQICEQLDSGTSWMRPLADGGAEISIDNRARLALYVLVDSFLFQCASIRDALLQFVNVVFPLGIPDDDRWFTNRVREQLRVSDTSNTGLEEWIQQAQCPPWLDRLLELRNITTHRQPIRLPEQYGSREYSMASSPTRGRVGIENRDGTFEPLENFVQNTMQRMAGLLRVSLEKLAELQGQ
jgi:hypothetical protein